MLGVETEFILSKVNSHPVTIALHTLHCQRPVQLMPAHGKNDLEKTWVLIDMGSSDRDSNSRSH